MTLYKTLAVVFDLHDMEIMSLEAQREAEDALNKQALEQALEAIEQETER